MGYAFISYSSKDQQLADATRQTLIESGIEIWMAPYDIPAGSKYAYVINDAIEKSACLVLLLTEDAQNSEFVEKEVDRAITYRKPIITMQLENIELNSGFKFYTSTGQIVPVKSVNANTPEMKKVIAGVKVFISNDVRKTEIPPTEPAPDGSDALTAAVPIDPNALSTEERLDYWLGRISGRDDTEACFQTALCYADKEAHCHNDEKACEYFKIAALNGHAEAQCRLAACYLNGVGVPQNLTQAFHWFFAAAEQGLPEAQYRLAMLYWEQSSKLTLHWIRSAAKEKHTKALEALAECYVYGIGVTPNYKKALSFYQKAAELGSKVGKKKTAKLQKLKIRFTTLLNKIRNI